MRAARLALALLSLTSCRRTPAAADGGPALPAGDVAVARDAPVARVVPAPAAPWCFERMDRADLRAIDDEGRLWTLTGTALARDDDARAAPLPSEVPCPARGAYAMEFTPDGAAFAVLDGRFYVRPTRAGSFAVTPACTDLAGAPWTKRAAGGWAFVANTWRSVGPGLLMTRDATAAAGWYAITAIDRSITAGVLDGNHSLLSLVNEGRLVVVDQVQTVAGEVLAAQGGGYSTLSRSAAGVVAARDLPGGRRTVVLGHALNEAFERIDATRDGSGETRAVVAIDLARFVAVTDTTVELSTDRGRSFRTVLRVASGDASGPSLERPQVGRLRDGRLAVATRDGLAVDRCR